MKNQAKSWTSQGKITHALNILIVSHQDAVKTFKYILPSDLIITLFSVGISIIKTKVLSYISTSLPKARGSSQLRN